MSQWKCTSGLQKHDFCMLACLDVFVYTLPSCFQTCMLLSDIKQIVRTFESRIPIQTFEKWHSYSYFSGVKSETPDVWRTGSWFLRPFGKRYEENQIYDLVKPNSTVKSRTVYRGGNVCYEVFLENGKNWL